MVAGDWGWLRRVLDLRLETCIDSLIVDSGYRLGNSGGLAWEHDDVATKTTQHKNPKNQRPWAQKTYVNTKHSGIIRTLWRSQRSPSGMYAAHSSVVYISPVSGFIVL